MRSADSASPSTEPSSATWRLSVLGPVRLEGPDQAVRLEPRTAAVLTYLALEGETPKYRLAGWLWPDSSETAARNNMRKLLSRFRALTRAELIVGEERIGIAPVLDVDAARLQELAFAGHHEQVLGLEGELLAGLDYDDAPDFDEWLVGARESLDALRRDAAGAASDRLERDGDLAGALRVGAVALERNPLSEEAHRRVMRLHYLMGDRGAALVAFEQCRSVLEREFGAQPMPETLDLARQIERGGQVPGGAPSTRPNLPLSVLRPPVLVGREREWAKLEAAWENGQVIFIIGQPGVGKSRLALDFAASRGEVLRFDGWAGDSDVPYATSTRNFRRILERRPGLELPAWVRRELARLLPELGEIALPISSEADKLRFFEAQFELVRRGCEGVAAAVIDDVQYYDAASVEFGMYMLAKAFPLGSTSGVPRFIETIRRGESPEAEAAFRRAAEAGIGAVIELEPLEASSVGTLLAGLELPGQDAASATELASPLARYTGGNPLFVLETVRHLLETGQLERGWPGRLPPPGKVGPLVAQRLERLSEPARRLAWAMAVLDADFSLERAARVLEADALDLGTTWAELEAAQVVRDGRFSHDLIFEATLASIPSITRSLLHRRAARALEEDPGSESPYRVAYHWLEGGEPARATPKLLEAAEANRARNRLLEAAELYRQAAGLLEAADQTDAAFAAYANEAELRQDSDFGEPLATVANRLLAMADSPTRRARAFQVEARRRRQLHDRAGYETAAREGLRHALEARDPGLEVDLLIEVADALWMQDRVDEAAAQHEAVLRRARELRDEGRERRALANLAYIRTVQGRLDDSVALELEALELTRPAGDARWALGILNNLSYTLVQAGRAREALLKLEEARGLLKRLQGEDYQRTRTHNLMSWVHRDLGEYALALEDAHEALGIAQARELPRAFLNRSLATVLVALGGPQDAALEIERGLSDRLITDDDRLALEMVRARLPGHDDGAALENLEQRVRATQRVRPLVQCLVVKASLRADGSGIEAADEALRLVRRHGLRGYETAAHTARARALLALGQSEGALAHAEAAFEMLQTVTPVDFSRAEVLFVHHLALRAEGDPAALTSLEAALAWVLETAEHRVPAAYRPGFLQQHPVNLAVRQASLAAGLEPPRR